MKICIDPGHGGHDPGAVGPGGKESVVVLAIALALGEYLEARGIEVCYTRSTDIFIPLGKRAEIANSARVDLFVSLHCNADADPDSPGMSEASGEEILVHPNSDTAKALAREMLPTLERLVPGRCRGIKERGDLAVLRLTRMPALLIECGFIDAREDGRILATDPTRAAGIIGEALLYALRAGGWSESARPGPPQTHTPSTPPEGTTTPGAPSMAPALVARLDRRLLQHLPLLIELAVQHGLPCSLVAAMAHVESRGIPWAVRGEQLSDASYGLMQLKPDTARFFGWNGAFVTELCDPRTGLEYGCRYLRWLADQVLASDGWEAVALAYNAGLTGWRNGKAVPRYAAKVLEVLGGDWPPQR